MRGARRGARAAARLGEDADALAHLVPDRAREGAARAHLARDPDARRVAVALLATRLGGVAPVLMHRLQPLQLIHVRNLPPRGTASLHNAAPLSRRRRRRPPSPPPAPPTTGLRGPRPCGWRCCLRPRALAPLALVLSEGRLVLRERVRREVVVPCLPPRRERGPRPMMRGAVASGAGGGFACAMIARESPTFAMWMAPLLASTTMAVVPLILGGAGRAWGRCFVGRVQAARTGHRRTTRAGSRSP